jgi:UPF0271 protein
MNIDFNADMGESFGMYSMGNDEGFMKFITSANIACAFHAGDPTVMKKTVSLAKKYSVQVGAHPGLPDLQGFGRREINMSMEEIYADMVYQVGALKAFAEAEGLRLHHVKPHGSLYGMAMRREEVAKAICQALLDVDKGLYLYELYADLDYDGDGNLVITRHHDIRDPEEVANRVIRMLEKGKVTTTAGNDIPIEGTSVCLHSDTQNASDIVEKIHKELKKSGYEVAAPAI